MNLSKPNSKYFIFLVIFIIVISLVISVFLYNWLLRDLPNPENIIRNLPFSSIKIVDRHGALLYELLPEAYGRHHLVSLANIPVNLINATIATEDVNFYKHPGIDIYGVIRAIWINIKGGETVAGGSTITQQLARNMLLNKNEKNERTIRRKIRESILAWSLTKRYSKEEILSLYLNYVYYGGFAYGVEAAAETFFAKTVEELDLAECALLAGLPQAPALYNPYTDFNNAKQRQLVVLDLMKKYGFISAEERMNAKDEPLKLAEKPYPVEAPHFIMMVRNEIDRLIADNKSLVAQNYNRGLTIKTTLDLNWQKIGLEAILQQIEKLKHTEDGLGHNVNNAALVAIDPYTGEILALIGSPDYFNASINGAINMAITPRQPGSALKPLIYAAAMDPKSPNYWTAATMLLDFTTSFITHDGKVYTPQNYDGLEHGPVLVRQALGSSLNIPAVKALDHIGLETFLSFTQKMGISSLEDPEQYDLSIALGGGSVSLLELSSAYASFANGGFQYKPVTILEIQDDDGNILYQNRSINQARILDERIAWLISDILSDDDARILGFGKNTALQLGFPAAVKTGTTTNFHDNWTIGYTPDLVVGVWVGNTSYQPMRDVTGLTGAAPIWHNFMRRTLMNELEKLFVRPEGMVKASICKISGLLPSQDCLLTSSEWFIAGTQPTKTDNIYHQLFIDQDTGMRANEITPPEKQKRITALDLPPEAANWANSNGFLLLSQIDQIQGNSQQDDESKITTLQVQTPASNSVFRLSAKLPVEDQKIKILILSDLPLDHVEIWMDDQRLAILNRLPYEYWWTLQPGDHHLWAESTYQNEKIVSATISFHVENAIQ